MSVQAEDREDALHWLRFAQEDLDSARDLIAQGCRVPRNVCWLALGAAEKALKGALIYLQIPFPKTHNLKLLFLLIPDGWRIKSHRADLAWLSEWSIESRYPGDWPDAFRDDAERAIAEASEILELIFLDFGNP